MPDDIDLVYSSLEMQLAMRTQAMGRSQNELIEKMRALPPALIIQYCNTDYIVGIDNRDIVIRVTDEVPPALRSLNQRWAIVTAYNPYSAQHTEKDNQALQERLSDTLAHRGYQTLAATGRSNDGNWEEESVLILGISYQKAKALGSSFQQNAIVFGEVNGPVELVFCDSRI